MAGLGLGTLLLLRLENALPLGRGLDFLRDGEALARDQRVALRGGGCLVEEVLVIAGVERRAAGLHMEDLLRERADKIDVVAHEDERAVELSQRADERVDARDVEVRRRLVHEKQIRRIEQELHEGETAFLAAAQHADILEHIVAAKQKRTEHRAHEFLARVPRVGPRLVEHRALRVEHLGAVLREVTDAGVVPGSRSPCWNGTMPARIFNSVDLPAPFGPTSTMR